MVSFIEQHRDKYGVEPICAVLPIAPSTYYEQRSRQADPSRLPARSKHDVVMRGHVRRVWLENRLVYGAKKVWKALQREGVDVARCTVARLMSQMGLSGAVRGKKRTTTHSAPAQSCPLDLVSRSFTASRPNELWVSDLTYVSTDRGDVYTSFVIDVFSRRIVGWQVSNSLRTDLVLDALEQALWDRQIGEDRLVHHSDRGSQYVSLRYTERLAEAGIEPSVGSVGDSYDNAMAESVIGLYKTEVIDFDGKWRNRQHVEVETLAWVAWLTTNDYSNRSGTSPRPSTRRCTIRSRRLRPRWSESQN